MNQEYVIVTVTMKDGEKVHNVLRSEQHREWLRTGPLDARGSAAALHDLLEAVGKDFTELAYAENYVNQMRGTVTKHIHVEGPAPMVVSDFDEV